MTKKLTVGRHTTAVGFFSQKSASNKHRSKTKRKKRTIFPTKKSQCKSDQANNKQTLRDSTPTNTVKQSISWRDQRTSNSHWQQQQQNKHKATATATATTKHNTTQNNPTKTARHNTTQRNTIQHNTKTTHHTTITTNTTATQRKHVRNSQNKESGRTDDKQESSATKLQIGLCKCKMFLLACPQ